MTDETSDETTTPRWVDLFGADPNFCDGKDIGEWLDEGRGDA